MNERWISLEGWSGQWTCSTSKKTPNQVRGDTLIPGLSLSAATGSCQCRRKPGSVNGIALPAKVKVESTKLEAGRT